MGDLTNVLFAFGYIESSDNSGFQVDCGMRLAGSDWRRGNYIYGSLFSARLYFRGEYGEKKFGIPNYSREFL